VTLTAAKARQLRSLIKQDGRLDHLLLLLPPDLLPRKGGRSENDYDAPSLASLELFLRAAKRERNMSRDAALHWLFDYTYKKGGAHGSLRGLQKVFGSNADAAVARLSRKLRASGLHKQDIKTLVPREWLEAGIDPEKFTTLPRAKTDD
jgi:hypothetical protein